MAIDSVDPFWLYVCHMITNVRPPFANVRSCTLVDLTSQSMLRFIREDIRCTKYSSVEPLEAISLETGIPVDQLVKVCIDTFMIVVNVFNSSMPMRIRTEHTRMSLPR